MSALWQQLLASGFRKPAQLLEFLDLAPNMASIQADKEFATRVPIGFAKKMRRGDLSCPLLTQVLPVSQEVQAQLPQYINDPLAENKVNPVKGLLHKYKGRVLITLASSCAINCRYCFRRHFPYQDNYINRDQWQNILFYIKQDPTISEVIFSGGDPLLIKNTRLASYIKALETIPHIKTLRFHSRIPVVLPERIDDEFLTMLFESRLAKVMVIHSNHPQELCDKTMTVFTQLAQHNVVLLNQSVLLKGVNDNSQVLVQLSKKLFEQGVLPYYLHTLDKVRGAEHFDLPLTKIKKLYQELQGLMPGYLVPKLVCEEAGKHSKTILSWK